MGSDNSHNNLLFIDLQDTFHTDTMVKDRKINFLDGLNGEDTLVTNYCIDFTIISLVMHSKAIFVTSLPPIFCQQPFIFMIPLFFHILLQKIKLKRD